MDVDKIKKVLTSLRKDVDPSKVLTDEDIKRIRAKSDTLGQLVKE